MDGANSPTPVLSLDRVSKRFGPVRALREVSLDFYSGETLGLLGENGAGKSTLLRTLSGDYQPDGGRLLIDGQEVTLRTPRDAHRQGVHVVYQEPELVVDLTVAENLSLGDLPNTLGMVSSGTTVKEARLLIEREGFAEALDPEMFVRDCSPAQRQCVEILKAVKGDVRILCLDEPTSSLSDGEAQRLWALMARLRERGTSIIYVSHRMTEINQLCQRVAVMRDGELVTQQPIGELSEDQMIKLMVGRPLGRMFPSRSVDLGEVVLELRGVTTASVHGIDLTVRAREIVGLAGLVGAGRTEIAQAIYGIDRILSGELRVQGKTVSLSSPAAAMRVGINLSPEDRKGQGLFLQRSVSDNVSLPLLKRLSRAFFVRARAERQLVRRMVDRMQVKARSPEALVSTLSGGNQQKVLLSRWVGMQPKLLILDEPTRGIDVGTKSEIYHLIDELTRDGMAVLMISSETSELIGLADRIVVVRDRRVVGELSAEEASEEAVLRLALGTRENTK